MSKRAWRPIAAEDYEQEVVAACGDIERLRAAVWARFAMLGRTADAPALAAALRDLRATVGGLLAAPVLAEWEPVDG